jgi:DNA-binding transcriptional MerR regulator
MHFVPAYYLQAQLNISAEEVRFFEEMGVLEPVTKNGRVFYSARDVYRLRAVLHFTRKRGMSLEKARERVDGGVVLRSALEPASSRK